MMRSHETDGVPAVAAMLPVDVTRKPVDLFVQLPVLADLRPAWRAELKKDEAVPPFGVALQKVIAVQLDVKSDQIAAQQSVEELFLPRADAKGLPVRPRDVPEMADDGV